MNIEVKVIGYIHTKYKNTKDIPRQSCIEESPSYIVLEPEFRKMTLFDGLENFSHIWLIWLFSKNIGCNWPEQVIPGGSRDEKFQGLFSTRCPFRPNPLAMSSVKLERIKYDEELGPVIMISGADLLDGTPIIDIKPYIRSDVHEDAIFRETSDNLT